MITPGSWHLAEIAQCSHFTRGMVLSTGPETFTACGLHSLPVLNGNSQSPGRLPPPWNELGWTLLTFASGTPISACLQRWPVLPLMDISFLTVIYSPAGHCASPFGRLHVITVREVLSHSLTPRWPCHFLHCHVWKSKRVRYPRKGGHRLCLRRTCCN